MEYGYLWLTLSLFLFLMTSGAAFVLAAVAFPLVKQADDERFQTSFRSFRWRKTLSYGLLSVTSVVLVVLLYFNPMYGLKEWTFCWMLPIAGCLTTLSVASVVVAGQLMVDGPSKTRVNVFGVLQWMTALTWFAGSCVLVWTLVAVVGLV